MRNKQGQFYFLHQYIGHAFHKNPDEVGIRLLTIELFQLTRCSFTSVQ